MPTTPLTKAQKRALREQMGEAIHTAFRKGSDHPTADQIWKLIREMPAEEWGKVVSFVTYGLGLR